MIFSISEPDKQFLLATAKKSIADQLNKSFDMTLSPSDQLNFNSGCFVTLSIDSNLRGCIGNFRHDVNITDNVIEMAGHAAFSDHRFSPLTAEEFTNTEIEISVLSPMIPIEDINNIVIGRDGLYMKTEVQSGVLLPQVATEHSWSTEEFLSHTCMKAGLPLDDWQKNPKLSIYRFEAIIFNDKK